MLKIFLFLAFLLLASFANKPSLNAQAATPLYYGQSITGNLPSTSSTATYSTPYAQPGDILLVRAKPASLMRLKIELFSPSGQFIAEYLANASRIVHFFYAIPSVPAGEPGEYLMVVSATDGFYTGNFCLYLQRANNPPDAVPLSCNYTFSSPLNCNATIMSVRYMVQQGANSRITIHSNSLARPEAWLCASDGTILRYGLSNQNYTLTLDTISAPYTGCYYIFVADHGAFYTSGFNLSHTLLEGDCAAPTVQTAPANGSVCAGSPLTLTADSTLPDAEYSWAGPNGFTSSEAEISFPEAGDSLAGAYTVTVTAPGICSSVLTRTITVKALPMATASVTPMNGSVCAGGSFTLDVETNIIGAAYQWSGPGNFSSTQKSPFLHSTTPNQSGSYNVSVTDSNGCVGKDSVLVSVHAPPAIVVSQPVNNGVCRGDTLQLFAQTNVLPATFLWTGPNSFSSTLQNPQIPNVNSVNAGTYAVTVTDAHGCYDNKLKYIPVWNPPTANISPLSTSICLGDSVKLSATGGNLYAWSNGVMTREIYVKPLQTTTYTVTVTDNNGCTDTENTIVTVNPLPSISLMSTPASTEICSGEGQILLSVTSSDANSPVWRWTRNGSFFSNNQFISLSNPGQSGIFTASVTDGITGCLNTAPMVTVNIHPTPAVNISHLTTPPYSIGNDIILCANSNATTPSYEWAGPNGFTATSACALVNNAGTLNVGTYHVTVTDINACEGFASENIAINIVGTVEPAEAWGLTIAPNPSAGIVQIRTDKPSYGKLHLALFDTNGRRIRDFWMETPTLVLDMTDLAPGFYVLRISDGEKAGAVRLAVIR